jgi:hypothetical protein
MASNFAPSVVATDDTIPIRPDRAKLWAITLDNLYVVDTSFFPSGTGLNPSLTVAANALPGKPRSVDGTGDVRID